MYLMSWLLWYIKGKPMTHYIGYHCGLCGKWCNEPFDVPTYMCWDEWHDTWGMCRDCRDEGVIHE